MVFHHLAAGHPPEARKIRLGAESRVLVFTCAGIGDTLTDSVVFKALAKTFPGIHLAAVIHRRRRILAEHNPFCREIFTLEKGFLAFRRLRFQLKNAGPWDAILHLRGNDPEPRCQSFLLDPSVTVSVPNMTRYDWLCGHHVVQPDWDDTHGVEQTLRIARYVGADIRDTTLVYEVRPEEADALEPRLASLGVQNKPRLVLQIGGGRRAHWRDWPVRRYAELIQIVADKLPCEIIVLGGKDNLPRVSELENLLGEKPAVYHNLVGKLNLAESAALLKSARAVVSTDTGIMHLSFAVGARVVALIHCNNPSHRVGPYGYGDRHRVLQLPRPKDYRSSSDADMGNITAEQVLDQLQEIWT